MGICINIGWCHCFILSLKAVQTLDLIGAPSRNRTYDLQLRKLTLYPTEL
jgi:hypothetical protein